MTTEGAIGIRVVTGVRAGRMTPAKYRLRTTCNMLVPMRDGVLLAMDLLRPDVPGKFPVILIRTPYDKVVLASSPERTFHEQLARRGYIVAIQDCRGRFNSDGVFDPYRQEHTDGFDTIEWIAAQDWCDGNVGMMGRSYVGQTQWFAAAHAPKALKAIVPVCSPPGHAWVNEPIWGGAILLGMAEWMYVMGRRSRQASSEHGLHTQEQPYVEALPLEKVTDAAGIESPWWNEWMSHPSYDEYWRSQGYEQYWSRMKVPALNVSGWWDLNFLGAPRNFMGMRELGATQEAREGQRLVIGPWPHWVNLSRTLSGVDFGPHAVTDLDAYVSRFFDYWLRGMKDNGLAEEPKIHVFVVGANEWWEADGWPLPGTQRVNFYLHSDGRANTHRGDGRLSRESPGAERHDQYDSDPLDPVRVLWNMHEGPVDDRAVSGRADVLCYTSEVLENPLDVVGHISAVLYASSSARDCDWHVRLVDVHPDGSARFLCHGLLRARFRNGFDHPEFLQPGLIERYEIDMTATGVRFLSGHRIRIEVSSTWFSRFDRNPQTDAVNWMRDERLPVVAQQRIYHDAGHASHVSLPVIAVAPK